LWGYPIQRLARLPTASAAKVVLQKR